MESDKSGLMFAEESFLPFSQLLLSHLHGEYGKSNCFVSPLSIYSALSLALCGASGNTHHEIAHTLHVQTVHAKDYDSTLAKLGKNLMAVTEGDTDNTLVLANGLFLDSNFEVNHFFTEALVRDFHTKAHRVNFLSSAAEARREINDWVANRTSQKIVDLMPPDSIDSQTRLVLANAIYFNGTWKKVFHRDATMDGPFRTLHDGEVQVPMMNDNGVYAMADFPDLKASALKIPFKFHEMLILLPHAYDGLPELLEKIYNPRHPSSFLELFKKSKYVEERVELRLPKFVLGRGANIDLKKPLSDMGLGLLFDQRAEFQRISENEKLHISEIVHRAVIEVNEEGAEAAAATGMAIAPMCLCPSFTVDHPFVFFIVTETGCPAFMGHVVNPLA